VLSSSFAGGVADVVKKVSNAVVSINLSVETQGGFFMQGGEQEGAGSGIIFSESDDLVYIATNNHVIENASKVSISVDDENTVPANYIGSDLQADLAVISVSKADLAAAGIKYQIAAFGDSSLLQVGEGVVAIGNAMGEGKTATSGIVSAIDKQITIEGKTLNVIQTDAAINPGNSGGALANFAGEVVGINTAKLSSEGVEGMGYSIPSNTAKEIFQSLIVNGSVQKPYLGIQGMSIDDKMKETYSLPSLGVYVADVTQGAAAQAAGMKASDIIVGFGDKKIATLEELQAAIADAEIGTEVEVYIYRNGSIPMTLKVVIGDLNGGTKF
jgi:serine protease Do